MEPSSYAPTTASVHRPAVCLRAADLCFSMTEAQIPSMIQNQKVDEARQFLAELDFGAEQQNDLSALVLLALANLAPGQSWDEATAPLVRTLGIMAWINDKFGRKYALNSRETIRSNVLRPFLDCGLVAFNPDDPSRSTRSPSSCYQLTVEALQVLRLYGKDEFPNAAKRFSVSLAASRASGRNLARQPHLNVLLNELVSDPTGRKAVEAAVIQGRRQILSKLHQLVATPSTNETAMQEILQHNHWIFGGQYIGVAPRRDLVPMQQHDILLVAADMSVTIVELKGPGDPLLGRPRDNHLTISSAVNNAVGQCMNYLRSMDEFALSLATKHSDDLALDYDFRRADSIVVIGHQARPGKITPPRTQVDQVLRMYNSHLSRIKVLTYTDLLESSERALQFDQ